MRNVAELTVVHLSVCSTAISDHVLQFEILMTSLITSLGCGSYQRRDIGAYGA